MKVAITGGTGFLGRNLAQQLVEQGHQVVLLARGHDQSDPGIRNHPSVQFVALGLDDVEQLSQALQGCQAVAHCAGINRELGEQTYDRVHIKGTRNLVLAAHNAGVAKIALSSFLRARPACGSAYHESKWAAEEIVRASGLDYTILKCGVIYGRGDHMLDHLSHAFYTFPVFGFVGFRDQPVRPVAVEEVCTIVVAALVLQQLPRMTVEVVGPEQLSLRQAVRRVAQVTGRRPLMFPLPLWFHYGLGWLIEKIMKVPMVSIAQVRMLSEGIVEAMPACEALPAELQPKIPFSEAQIRRGLPPPGPFRLDDLQLPWVARPRRARIAFHSEA